MLLLLLVAAGCGGGSGGAADGGDANRDAGRDGSTLDAPPGEAGPRDAGLPDRPEVVEPPPPPEWDPPFELGEPGWRESTDPFCSPYAGRLRFEGVDIWADHRGVFVLETIENWGTPFELPYRSGTTLQFNDGSGWASWLDMPREPGSGGGYRMNGTPAGPVWLWPGACPLRRVDGPDESRCVYAEDASIQDVHMLGETSGWLLLWDRVVWLDEDGPEDVGRFDSDERLRGIWGDADGATVVTDRAVYRARRDAEMAVLREAEPEAELTALWARDAGDYWVGTESGTLLRFEGGEWTTAANVGGYVSELWSDGSSLYFVSSYDEDGRIGIEGQRFGRWTETGGVEVLLDYEGLVRIGAMAGDADSGEVYLAFVDGELVEYACGPAVVVWFDGEEFHRF